ncbi:MAG: HD domain-containing protein [Thermotogota bacterium]|nr:HD domain-containing protein [Thermotogota bacterium]
MDEIAQMVRHHHERWDGTGYPDRFIAEEIPISSRIITIADAYDAMTSERPYRKSIRKASVIEEFRRISGTQFDPRLTNLFIGIISRTDFQE